VPKNPLPWHELLHRRQERVKEKGDARWAKMYARALVKSARSIATHYQFDLDEASTSHLQRTKRWRMKEAKRLLGEGKTTAEVCAALGVVRQTLYRYKRFLSS
jgi:hypothetical protein